MEVIGLLKNVDHFLNLQLKNAKIKNGILAIQELDLCSIRGSSVKSVELEKNEELEERILDATLLRFSLDK